MLAANIKRGERPPPPDPAAWLAEEFRPRIAAVVESWKRRRDRALLVRYEDLMTEPQATLTAVLEYLGLDAGAGAVEAMLSGAGRPLPEMDRHRTTASPEASIGRWRQDLDPALAEQCERVLGDAIAALGYSRRPEQRAHGFHVGRERDHAHAVAAFHRAWGGVSEPGRKADEVPSAGFPTFVPHATSTRQDIRRA